MGYVPEYSLEDDPDPYPRYPSFVPYALTPGDHEIDGDNSVHVMQYVYSGKTKPSTNASWGADYVGAPIVGSNPLDAVIFDNYYFRDYVVVHANGDLLFEQGTQPTITYNNLISSVYQGNLGDTEDDYRFYFDSSKITKTYLLLTNPAEELIEVEPVSYEIVRDDTYPMELHITVELPVLDFDVYRVSFAYEFDYTAYTGFDPYLAVEYVDPVYREYGPSDRGGFTMSVDVKPEDKYSGFLSGIIEWLRSIRDGIVNVKDGVLNVVNSIKELPAKIWQLISDGLQSLFIPSEDAIVRMKDDWDALMSDRFGALYDCGSLLTDMFGTFQDSHGTQSSLEFPSVTVQLAGTPFTFGGWSVPVIPDRFKFLVTTLKLITNAVCTLAFLNSMKNRFARVFGGD